MFWKRILYYLNPMSLFKKGGHEGNPDFSLKAMHGMNRISVFVFVFAVFMMIYKYLTRS